MLLNPIGRVIALWKRLLPKAFPAVREAVVRYIWKRPSIMEDFVRLHAAGCKDAGETSLMFMVHPTLTVEDMEDTVAAVRKVMKVAGK